MTLVVTAPNAAPGTWVEIPTQGQSPVLALLAEFDLPSCTAVAGFTTAAIIAALGGTTGPAEVCFPPGVYDVTALIAQGTPGQVLNFQVGAVLRFAASGLGKLQLNGAGASIVGKPVARFDAASAVAYVAIDLHGDASTSEVIRCELNADVSNCTLIRLSGDYAQLAGAVFAGAGGAFKYGVELSHQDGTQVALARVGLMVWQVVDDGVLHTSNAWLRMRSTVSQAGPFSIRIGARQFFNAIIETDGQHNSLLDPQISSSAGSNFGILMKDDAEFLAIYDGELVGNYLAGSIGIACGDGSKLVGPPAVGQLKCYDTKIRNWDIGVKINGTCDSPGFFGATIANNKTDQVRVDCQRGADIWPVSGLAFFNCYSEDVAFSAAKFLHLVSGALEGGVICGGEIGYTDTAVLVEAAMSTNKMEFLGARFPSANGVTDAVTTPNANSNFFFGRNSQNGAELIGKGAFASKATSIDNIVCATLKCNTSLQIGAAGDPFFQENFTFATANFAAGIPALDMVELPFAWAQALVVRMLTFSLNGALAANTALSFECYCPSNGNVTLRARNNTAVAVGAVAGTLFLRSTKIL